ncbi:benzyl alcohol O-benzoyltransferase-like [Sesamum indicum]|uniref:Benzyl alcohol O-benzoyltransferase-like n=1 Tax=Sesamum indicum TaxID=4182 RepID=A0A6I9TKJ7_SESIN|nr:benzyl alcohol O-benzoyltransferase-like [Sesamum indicum]
MASPNALTFKVTRKNTELIPPAKPTPHEFKPLSDIDDQEGLRFQLPLIAFFPKNPAMDRKDPVKVFRDALAKALVFYYPFAGRLRETAGRKLVVECTGEGALFIEADADVGLQQFGDTLQPPFPCLEELLYDVPGSGGMVNCPLLLIQVTRLKCGGFIFAFRANHTMSDGFGLFQFASTMAELARGAEIPSVLPVWQRHLVSARDPPHVSYMHDEYENIPDAKETLIPLENMVQRSFFFGPGEISALRRHLSPHLRRCTTFELLAACIWRCRTIAISPDPNEEVRILCFVNGRRLFNPLLPAGYYGNVVATPLAISTAENLCKQPLNFALELVMKAKSKVTEDYIKSVANLMIIRGRPHFAVDMRTYIVSDLTHVASDNLDYGWGAPVFGGPAKGGAGVIPGLLSFHIPIKNIKGERGKLVPICLPANAMEVFVKELETMVKRDDDTDLGDAPKSSIFKGRTRL